jgi:hypothetical protein
MYYYESRKYALTVYRGQGGLTKHKTQLLGDDPCRGSSCCLGVDCVSLVVVGLN